MVKSLLYNIVASRYCKTNLRKITKQIMQSQYFMREELCFYQKNKLKNLLKKIREKNKNHYINKYDYKDILKAKVRLDKNTLRDNFDNIYSKASKKEYIHITSGSTGVPIKIIVSNVAEAYRRAQQLRFYSWWGIHPYDKNVLIWGRLQKDKQKSGIKKIIKTKIGLSSYFIDVFTLSSFIIRKYFFDIKKLQPKFIRGYTSGIFRFCNLIENEGLDAKKLGIKVAIVTSEILFPGHREYIQNILGCPVANEYGSSETGLIAYDCKYQQMHLCEETAMVLMDKKGKMLVSDLYNLSTPLINYEIGDKIILSEEKCKCGRESRIIKIIKGREGDEVKTIDGRFLSSHIFTYIFKDLNKTESPRAIKQYKVYQKGTFFDLYIVKDKNFSLKTINYVVDRMEKAIGRGIKVNIHYVDEIKREKSGKLRHFVREG